MRNAAFEVKALFFLLFQRLFVATLMAVVVSCTSAQSYQHYNPFLFGFAPYYRPSISSLTSNGFGLSNMRDPRSNTGKAVIFFLF